MKPPKKKSKFRTYKLGTMKMALIKALKRKEEAMRAIKKLPQDPHTPS